MNAELRTRRLNNEWDLLARLAQANPDGLHVVSRQRRADGDWVRIVLHRTSGLVKGNGGFVLQEAHTADFRFPDLFPAVPIEAFLTQPVFHPNVHPDKGFVCLWSRFSAGDTIIEAVRQLQRVIRWEIFNEAPDHVMQPDALAAAGTIERPLASVPIIIPPDLAVQKSFRALRQSRRRLSEPLENG